MMRAKTVHHVTLCFYRQSETPGSNLRTSIVQTDPQMHSFSATRRWAGSFYPQIKRSAASHCGEKWCRLPPR